MKLRFLIAALCLLGIGVWSSGCADKEPLGDPIDPSHFDGPVYMRILSGGRYAIVNNSNYTLAHVTGSLIVVDLQERKILPDATFAVPSLSRCFTLNPDESRLYLVDSQRDSLLVYKVTRTSDSSQPVEFEQILLSDIEKEDLDGGIEVGEDPNGCVFVDRGAGKNNRVYVSNVTTADVTVFDPDENVVYDYNQQESDKTGLRLDSVETLEMRRPYIGIGANRFFKDPSTGLLWLTVTGSDDVFVLDPMEDEIEAVVEMDGITPSGGTRSAVVSGGVLWASHNGLDGVVAADVSDVSDDGQPWEILTGRWFDFVATGKDPEDIALNATGDLLYVANFGERSVSVVDTSIRAVVSSIEVGKAPLELVVNSDRNELYVINFLDNSISVVDMASGSVVGTIR